MQIKVDPNKMREKDSALNEMLVTHSIVQVHVNTTYPGVMVPELLRNQPQVTFEVGLNLPTPVRDIRIDAEGWSATLSFGRRPYTCYFPWDSVFCIASKDTGIGAIWQHDAPLEIRQKIQTEQRQVRAASSTTAAAQPQPAPIRTLPKGWRVIEGGKKDEPDSGPHSPKAS